jgi:hypothetical protein
MMLKYLSSILKSLGNSDHQAVIDALSNAMGDIRTNTDQLPNELNITTASAEWLERWGEWFGVNRLPNETDIALQGRVLDTLTQLRLTIPAITALTKKVLGADTIVTIYEPYTDMFQLDNSTLDNFLLTDGDFYRMGVVDVSVNKVATPEWIALLNTIKAAGTKIIGRGI